MVTLKGSSVQPGTYHTPRDYSHITHAHAYTRITTDVHEHTGAHTKTGIHIQLRSHTHAHSGSHPDLLDLLQTLLLITRQILASNGPSGSSKSTWQLKVLPTDPGLRQKLNPVAQSPNKTHSLSPLSSQSRPLLSPTIQSPQRRRCASCESWSQQCSPWSQ